MSPRERILKILRGQQPDQVPWFGDLDYWAAGRIGRGETPPDFVRSDAYLDWHRELGVGFYLQGYFPFTTHVENVKQKEWREGNSRYLEYTTPQGALRSCWQWLPQSFTEAPIEHLVKDERDLPAYRFLYENMHFTLDYDFARQRIQQVKEMGIVLCYAPKTPFMQLVALDAGIENVTYISQAAPDEFSATLHIMETTLDKAVSIAINSPAEALMIPENLSSEVVGQNFFEKYMRQVQEKWITKINKAGKFSFIHMDGTLEGLLRQECRTGVTVLEALTPAPVGDLKIEEWENFAGDSKTIFWGGIPGSYFTPLVKDEEFDRHIINVLAVMRKKPRYVLGVADQVPPDALEYRVRRVRELVAEFGNYATSPKPSG
ncbi:hypothetical protein L0Z72_10980 [candidate division KSB1 bacterium]|nr:hypothetical protein [candidate division KSB1 bacterium]